MCACVHVCVRVLQTILASGVTLSLFAASAVIKTRAAAPSFSVLALAAVTVPEEQAMRNKIYITFLNIYIKLQSLFYCKKKKEKKGSCVQN